MDTLSDRELLEEIDEEGVGLTSWEKKFVDNLMRTLVEGESLSPKQRGVLEKIYEERVP